MENKIRMMWNDYFIRGIIGIESYNLIMKNETPNLKKESLE